MRFSTDPREWGAPATLELSDPACSTAYQDPQYLQLQWAERLYHDDESKTAIVTDPTALLAQLALNLDWQPEGTPGHLWTYEGFFKEAQSNLLSRVKE